MEGLLLVDGKPVQEIQLPADDLGLGAGLSVFETLRATLGRPYRLLDHLSRLADGATQLGIPCPERSVLEAEIHRVVAALGLPEQRIRLQLSAGGRRILRAAAWTSATTPVVAVTRCWESPPWPPATVKHGSRAGSVLALRQTGAGELIRLDREGLLLEGTWSNVWAEVEGMLYTPPAEGRILPGVTRGALLKLALEADLPVLERRVGASEPISALYLSSALRGLVRVSTLDDEALEGGSGIGERLQELLERDRRS